MTREPLTGVSADAWKAKLGEDYSDEALAAALAGAWNESGWLEHDLCDNNCTPEKESACEEWFALGEELIQEVALRMNRKCETPYIKWLTSFMKQNGYRDGTGW